MDKNIFKSKDFFGGETIRPCKKEHSHACWLSLFCCVLFGFMTLYSVYRLPYNAFRLVDVIIYFVLLNIANRWHVRFPFAATEVVLSGICLKENGLMYVEKSVGGSHSAFISFVRLRSIEIKKSETDKGLCCATISFCNEADGISRKTFEMDVSRMDELTAKLKAVPFLQSGDAGVVKQH